MHSLLTSIGVVAVSEIGDKTQLVALMLACRFRKPWPIVAGILVATTLNHALAAILGVWAAAAVSPTTLRWGLAVLFFAMAGWALIPDRIEDDAAACGFVRAGPFAAAAVIFFLAEIGDKTQIATAALAAQFDQVLPVVAGRTLGMLAADVPVVFVGSRFGRLIDLRFVRYLAAAVFAALGALALAGAGIW